MTQELSRNERIKEASAYLRGTLAEGLREEITGGIIEDDAQLVKFHGMYLQDDRDLRGERGRKKMEKAFSFMIRVRVPGGVCTPGQFINLDHIARTYGNGTMRLTTRQTFQLHGVIKSNLKATMREIDEVLLTTIAACGDVNRNVLCNPNPYQSRAHAASLALARALSDHLLPRTPAYREIWLDGERIAGGEEAVVEPIYGKTYLPRKFKIVIAVPPSNDVDVYAHDLGFIAILDNKHEIDGYNVTVGGGMGMTHGEPETYPRTADVMGYCRPDQAIAVAEAVVTVQRDWGDRVDRKHARLKYTIEDRGLDAFRAEVEQRSGVKLAAAKPFTFTSTGDRYGWTESERYLPDLVTALEERLAAHGLAEDDIVIRMTGCPNGCARPYVAEIGLVGKGPGRYNLYLGAAFDGSRLSKLYADNLDHGAIIANLDPIFAAYKSERRDGERFGDYVIRAGFIAATVNGSDFHKDTGARR